MKIPVDHSLAEPFTCVGRDGLEYTIPAEHMPSSEKWEKLTPNMGFKDWSIRLPKRRAPNDKQLMAARIVVVDKGHGTSARLGWELGGELGEAVKVLSVSPGGLISAVKPPVCAGDELLAINHVRPAHESIGVTYRTVGGQS